MLQDAPHVVLGHDDSSLFLNKNIFSLEVDVGSWREDLLHLLAAHLFDGGRGVGHLDVLFVHLLPFNVLEVVLGADESSSEQFLQLFPVVVETLNAEITVEGVAICGPDNSGFGVGASFFVVEVELFN